MCVCETKKKINFQVNKGVIALADLLWDPARTLQKQGERELKIDIWM